MSGISRTESPVSSVYARQRALIAQIASLRTSYDRHVGKHKQVSKLWNKFQEKDHELAKQAGDRQRQVELLREEGFDFKIGQSYRMTLESQKAQDQLRVAFEGKLARLEKKCEADEKELTLLQKQLRNETWHK